MNKKITNLTNKISVELLKEQSKYNEITIPNFYYNKGKKNYKEYYECDLFKISKSGYTIEFEIKISLEDYKHDFTKSKKGVTKHELIATGKRTNKFFYVIPENIIPLDLIPNYCGVIVYNEKQNKFITVRNA
ncbi:MAG: hypothetical protein RSE41_06390 [Clostridia bacterium]